MFKEISSRKISISNVERRKFKSEFRKRKLKSTFKSLGNKTEREKSSKKKKIFLFSTNENFLGWSFSSNRSEDKENFPSFRAAIKQTNWRWSRRTKTNLEADSSYSNKSINFRFSSAERKKKNFRESLSRRINSLWNQALSFHLVSVLPETKISNSDFSFLATKRLVVSSAIGRNFFATFLITMKN